ncbi:hypothetical protein [Marinimicrobium sp. ABcell2]|uniref:hypothetical protein n=1 Tax=Marinimicrobium sp. ABcell2 TaxID=3069751 RepID=UPI0027B4096D|nr:hypothetical protein [Marinimicrobium sp. ABcell2]MDQ2076201.1 hypothetical protein [Marinimicrobium sp. ABcell2]
MIRRFPFLLPALLFLTAAPATAEDLRVWLIGGGNNLGNSQGQIEENVRWLEDIFANRGIETRTYYTHGEGADGSDDVIYFALPDERDPVLEPILRVFGEGLQYAQKTRTNSLQNIVGSTEKSQLTASLAEDFSRVGPDDSVLLVYNGHGDIDTSNTLNNNLLLWNNTSLNIGELNDLLGHITPEADVRFVLTQCFSGSFASLVYESPESTTLASQKRCGFLAESDRREAEGCDLGTNQAEFRDYTTFFFAALNQKTRLGEEIPAEEIDLDGSGEISFREAHLYTLRNAHSSDLSRSTSEVFMEQWEPWYLRWNSFGPRNPDNDYRQARDAVAERHQLPARGLNRLRAERRLLAEEAVQVEQTRALRREVQATREALREQLQESLPNMPEVTMEHLASLPDNELEHLSQVIQSSELYPELLEIQAAAEHANEQLLMAARDRTQAEKVFRLSRLSRLETTFTRYAGADTRRDLDIIASCEAGTL